MSIKLNRAFDPVVKLFSGKSKSSTSKKFRWKVVQNGRVVSKHFTKAAATKKASSLRGARVVSISSRVVRSSRKKVKSFRKRR